MKKNKTTAPLPLREKNSPTKYTTSTNNAACKYEHRPKFAALTANVVRTTLLEKKKKNRLARLGNCTQIPNE